MEESQFDIALNNCNNVVQTYADMERLNFEAQETAQTEEDTYKYRFRPII